MKSIGAKATDKYLYDMSREIELESAEERDAKIAEYEETYGELQMPKLKPDPFTIFDFYFDGKPYKNLDDIMLWVAQKTRKGEPLPNKPEDVVRMFEAL